MWDPSTNHDLREALFGGHGAVRVWNLSQSPMPPFTALLACELDPGGSVGLHLQQEFPETLIVVEGHGQAKVSGEPVTLAPGSVVFLPLGKTLALENGSANVPLRYLIIKARG